jgi:hypothetical protein
MAGGATGGVGAPDALEDVEKEEKDMKRIEKARNDTYGLVAVERSDQEVWPWRCRRRRSCGQT